MYLGVVITDFASMQKNLQAFDRADAFHQNQLEPPPIFLDTNLGLNRV